ncbi:MAG: hypothetical protein OWT27_04365 [Firmicutes bacterium]|nr:hypothetical protein [Bacillota bacterium]
MIMRALGRLVAIMMLVAQVLAFVMAMYRTPRGQRWQSAFLLLSAMRKGTVLPPSLSR